MLETRNTIRPQTKSAINMQPRTMLASEFCDIDKAINKIFEGYKVKFKKFFTVARDTKSKKATGYSLNQQKID